MGDNTWGKGNEKLLVLRFIPQHTAFSRNFIWTIYTHYIDSS
jgi:hypothetical protein